MRAVTICFLLLLCSSCGDLVLFDDFDFCSPLVQREVWVGDWDGQPFDEIKYEYNSNGTLKYFSKGIDKVYWEKEILYNSMGNVATEIIHNGLQEIDTVLYEYNEFDQLDKKITIKTYANSTHRDTVKYTYNNSGLLIEERNSTVDNNFDYRTVNEYAEGLLRRQYRYVDGELLREVEYEYENGSKVKESIYLRGRLEYSYVFLYKNGLLDQIEGYFGSSPEIDSIDKYIYDKYNRLITKKVDVPTFSSTPDYVIYYYYY